MNRIISELSCETEDGKFSFATTGINYMHLNIQNGNNNDFSFITVLLLSKTWTLKTDPTFSKQCASHYITNWKKQTYYISAIRITKKNDLTIVHKNCWSCIKQYHSTLCSSYVCWTPVRDPAPDSWPDHLSHKALSHSFYKIPPWSPTINMLEQNEVGELHI